MGKRQLQHVNEAIHILELARPVRTWLRWRGYAGDTITPDQLALELAAAHDSVRRMLALYDDIDTAPFHPDGPAGAEWAAAVIEYASNVSQHSNKTAVAHAAGINESIISRLKKGQNNIEYYVALAGIAAELAIAARRLAEHEPQLLAAGVAADLRAAGWQPADAAIVARIISHSVDAPPGWAARMRYMHAGGRR